MQRRHDLELHRPATHATSFTYQARVIDEAANVGDTDSQEIIINQPPDAIDDADTVAEGAAKITVNVLANDTDPDSILTFGSITAFTQGANGTVAYNNNGTFTYTHNGSETTSDSFTYTITDDAGDTDTATVNLTVTPVNDAPVVATAIPDQTSRGRHSGSSSSRPTRSPTSTDLGVDLHGEAGQRRPAAGLADVRRRNADLLRHAPRDGALDQAIALQVTASDGRRAYPTPSA